MVFRGVVCPAYTVLGIGGWFHLSPRLQYKFCLSCYASFLGTGAVRAALANAKLFCLVFRISPERWKHSRSNGLTSTKPRGGSGFAGCTARAPIGARFTSNADVSPPATA